MGAGVHLVSKVCKEQEDAHTLPVPWDQLLSALPAPMPLRDRLLRSPPPILPPVQLTDQPLLPHNQAALVPMPVPTTSRDLTAPGEPRSAGDAILPDPLVPLGPDNPSLEEDDEGYPLTPSEPFPEPRIPDYHSILPSGDVKAYGELVKRRSRMSSMILCSVTLRLQWHCL